MSNAIYGKAMENLRNRIGYKTSKQRNGLFQIYTKTELYIAQSL